MEQEIKNNYLPYSASGTKVIDTVKPLFDTVLYQLRIHQLANDDQTGRWPPDAAYPIDGAILPFNRIVAFYGNFYSPKMGILGQYPEEEMLNQLKTEIQKWEKADPAVPVIPALHYIAVSAQRNASQGGKYRLRMPFSQIDKAVSMAQKADGIVFLDIQVGLSTLQEEVPALENYLTLPGVHLGIDPEFSMKSGLQPGSSIGTFDAVDINFVSAYLSGLVIKNKLTPKILVVHRFNKGMVTNYKRIITRPEVQIVFNMDGFGFPAKKKNSYYHSIFKEPVQFAGFKLFYKNDTLTGDHLMTPAEILKLIPQPIYIQYH